MIYNSKKEQKKEMVAIAADIKEELKELNEEILRVKKKKAEVGKTLSNLQAELIYKRTVLKETKDLIKEL